MGPDVRLSPAAMRNNILYPVKIKCKFRWTNRRNPHLQSTINSLMIQFYRCLSRSRCDCVVAGAAAPLLAAAQDAGHGAGRLLPPAAAGRHPRPRHPPAAPPGPGRGRGVDLGVRPAARPEAVSQAEDQLESAGAERGQVPGLLQPGVQPLASAAPGRPPGDNQIKLKLKYTIDNTQQLPMAMQ